METRYAIHIFWSDEDAGFIAISQEFPGLSAFGETREEALQEAQKVLDEMIEIYHSKGMQLPEPAAAPLMAA